MIDPTQLTHFRERQLQTLMDTCRHRVYSRTIDDYGQPIETWTDAGIDIPCGLQQMDGNEVDQTSGTVVVFDAVIRLQLSDDWDVKDQVTIIKRFGETLETPIVYDVVSPIKRGPSGISLLLKRVEI